MPWKRAKALPPPSNELFDACFRIQREASEAAGHHIPMVVENVKGAQPWVGRAAWHYGSFYLWGDVPALMPPSKFVKLPGNDTFKATGQPCNKFTDPRYGSGVKQHGSGAAWWDKALDERRKAAGVKVGSDAFRVGFKNSAAKLVDAAGLEGFNVTPEERKVQHMSRARKAASAQIAKIPFELARWIADVYKPDFAAPSGPAVPGTQPVYGDPLAGESAAKNGDCTQRTGPVEGEGSRGNNPASREPSGESPEAGKPGVQPSGQIPERSAKFGMSDLRTARLPLL
jgi:hypothetical protein